MGRTEDLEDELRLNWNDGTLAVYADHLQAIGDPRGEMIALDLRRDDGVEARRGELLRKWFSPLPVWWDADDRTWYAGDRRGGTVLSFERGFVGGVLDGNDVSTLLRFFKHPACDYLQRLSIAGSSIAMRAALGGLARREHHWLVALALQRPQYDDELIMRDTSGLVAATPCLELLDITGRRVLGELDHPAVRELALTGHDAVQLTDAPMAAVLTLDFAFERGSSAAENGVAWILAAKRFPALRRLRLSRIPDRAVFASLSQVDLLPRLSHLELPALREQWDIRHAQAALDRMPKLSELAFVRAYSLLGDLGADLHHPSARIRIPSPVPWPPPDSTMARRALFIDDIRIEVPTLASAMEEQFEGLPDDIQNIWYRFWDGLYHGPSREHGLDHGLDRSFRADELLRALDALVFDHIEINALTAPLRAELRTRTYEVALRWL